jgi:tripeptide aminopeptidase
MKKLKEFEINSERLINTFITLVKIPSPSWKEGDLTSHVVESLSSLGLECELFPCGQSNNLLARLPGKGGVPVLFSSHMDTVGPCEKINPIINKTRITSDGTSVLGSDDKSAIAMFIEALAVIKEKNLPHGPIEFLFTCAEEIGLVGAKSFDMSRLNAKYAFVFDCGGPVGTVILKAPYQTTISVSIKGRAAHAGIEPEKGVSAIAVAADIISSLPCGRIDEETTMNIGVIKGGTANNIVAENAEFTMEIRSIDRKKLARLETLVKDKVSKAAGKRGALHKTKMRLEYPGFSIRPESKIIRIVDEALKSIRIEPVHIASGGGSDTNIFNKAGIKAVNLSSGMSMVHTTSEYIRIKDLKNGARLVLSIIEQAGPS